VRQKFARLLYAARSFIYKLMAPYKNLVDIVLRNQERSSTYQLQKIFTKSKTNISSCLLL